MAPLPAGCPWAASPAQCSLSDPYRWISCPSQVSPLHWSASHGRQLPLFVHLAASCCLRQGYFVSSVYRDGGIGGQKETGSYVSTTSRSQTPFRELGVSRPLEQPMLEPITTRQVSSAGGELPVFGPSQVLGRTSAASRLDGSLRGKIRSVSDVGGGLRPITGRRQSTSAPGTEGQSGPFGSSQPMSLQHFLSCQRGRQRKGADWTSSGRPSERVTPGRARETTRGNGAVARALAEGAAVEGRKPRMFQLPENENERQKILSSAPESTAEELSAAAQMAQLSGLAYLPDPASELRARGFRLVAAARTRSTAYFIADGPAEPSAAADSSFSDLPRSDSPNRLPEKPKRTRYVVTRGVAWGSQGVDSRLIWRQLSKFWPMGFEEALTGPGEELVAHAGVQEMAEEVFGLIRRFLIVDLAEEGISAVHFGGHSLGGSLALLLMLKTHLHRRSLIGGRSGPSDVDLMVHTFGAPPVLARGTSGKLSGLGQLGFFFPGSLQPNLGTSPNLPTNPSLATNPSKSPNPSPAQKSNPPTNPSLAANPSKSASPSPAKKPKSQARNYSQTTKVPNPTHLPVDQTPNLFPDLIPDLQRQNELDIVNNMSPMGCGRMSQTQCDVMRSLGLPSNAVRAYVLDQDIIPRAFLAADPVYRLALRIGVVRSALEWREKLLGSSRMLTQDKFLFQTVGDVHFMWSQDSVVNVRRLNSFLADSVLNMDIGDLLSQPTLLLRTVTDHNHRNYRLDLAAAARDAESMRNCMDYGNS